MDRTIVYAGELPRLEDFMGFQKDALYALGYIAQAMLGSPTAVAGLACAATSPASLQVTVGVGSIYEMETVDATAYGALGTDSNTILKQGLLEAPTTLSITPPTTSGYSQVYLIEANYNDVDTNAIVLPYYNSANPSQPLNGPNNSGTQQNTIRAGQCVIALKAGAAAPTGSQVAPAVDSGYAPLYLITVANGQTTITSANIAVYSGAPFIPLTLPQVPLAIQQQLGNYAIDTGSANALAITLPAYTTLVAGTPLRIKKGSAGNTGAITLTVNGGSPISVLWEDASPFTNGDWPAHAVGEGVYDGTVVQMHSPVGPTLFAKNSTIINQINISTARGSTKLSAFTAGEVVSDIAADPSFTTIQTTGNFTGATYVDASGTCSLFDNASSGTTGGGTTRIAINDVTASTQILSNYVGGGSQSQATQICLVVPRAIFTLNPAHTYNLTLLAQKGASGVGPTEAFDTYLFAQHDGTNL